MSQSAVPTKPVVTLFEQYGAGADYIGPKLAERFGVQYVGYRWSSEELEQLHATPAEEQTAFDRFMVAAGRGAEPGESTPVHLFQMADNEAVNANSAELNAMAAKGLVVLGRNATTAIKVPALHVKLVADQATRIKHAQEAYKLDEASAKRRQAWEDNDRAQMALHYYGWDPRGTDGFDLIVDTGKGLDAALAEIEAAARKKLGL